MGDDNEEDKHDLTSLTDIGEFLHELDAEVDAQLDHAPSTTPGESEESEDEEPMEFNEFKVPGPDDDATEESGLEEGFGEEDSEESSGDSLDFSSDGFGEDEENSSFGEDSGDSFGENSGDSFGEDSADSFGEDSADSFGEDSGDSFTEDSNDSSEEDSENLFEEDADNSLQASEETLEENPAELEEADTEEDSPLEEAPAFDSSDDFLDEDEKDEGPKITPLEVQKDQHGAHQETLDIAPPSAPTPPPASFSPGGSGTPSSPPENFSDVKEFAGRMSYGVATGGGNPPFSIILKNIKYSEDGDDILRILKEHGLSDDSNEEDYKKGIDSGSVIISQVSEFTAIILSHKFRRFDLDILVGFSEEIHPSNSYDNVERGLVKKSNLTQNKRENVELENSKIDVNSILVTTTQNLENFQIHRYIGIVTDHHLISEDDLQTLHKNELKDPSPKSKTGNRTSLDLRNELDETFEYSLGLVGIYKGLCEKLKIQAHKLKSNAVVGVSFQLTPLLKSPTNENEVQKLTYKITCTGNAVFVSSERSRKNEVTP